MTGRKKPLGDSVTWKKEPGMKVKQPAKQVVKEDVKQDFTQGMTQETTQEANEADTKPEEPTAIVKFGPEWTVTDQARAHFANADFKDGPYLRGCAIGYGGYSIVYKVLRKSDGKVFAGKSSRFKDQLHKEARALGRMDHENILKFEEFYREPGNPAASLVITELCAGDTLQSVCDDAPLGLANWDVLDITTQVAGALEYIHKRKYFHSDLKPFNILIRSKNPYKVVIGDCADVKIEDTRSMLRNTPLYRSPENIALGRYNGAKDDIWALGATMLLMAGQMPVFVRTREGLEDFPRQCRDHIQQLRELNPRHPTVRVIERLLAWEAAKRPAAAAIHRLCQVAK